MKKQMLLMILFAVANVSCCLGQAADMDKGVAVNVKVTLHDGSQLLGTSLTPSLALITNFGKQEIPLVQIASLDVAKDGVKVWFPNKDALSGKPESPTFALKTIFNDVRLDYSQIKVIQFSANRGGGVQHLAADPGLLLHILFDSDTEDLGAFGARMEATNAQIVEGNNGKAMLLDSEDARVTIHLPSSPYLMPEGTIEFWAKFPQPHQNFSHSLGQPWFFNVWLHDAYPGCHMGLGFAYNDGHGRGGLIGRMLGILLRTHALGEAKNLAETGFFGDNPDGWHHYSLVWKWDGVDFPDVEGKTLLATIDGKVVGSSNTTKGTIPADIEQDPDMGKRLIIHDSDSDCTRPIAMCDLKIWNYAKLPE